MANEVLKLPHVVEDLNIGEGAFVLYDIVCRHVREVSGSRTHGFAGILAQLLLGQDVMARADQIMCGLAMTALPRVLLRAEKFVQQQMDVEETLYSRLVQLRSSEFEDMLHPVFEQDEWKLIAVGALLGLLVGFAQAGLNILAT